MKKTITFILVFCLSVLCIPFMFACDEEEEKYWLNTDAKYKTFVTDTLNEYVNGFTFNDKINQNIANNYSTYKELDDIYSPLYLVSIGLLPKYQDCFKLEPVNKTKNVKNEFIKFNKKIEELSASLYNFKELSITKFNEGVKGTNKEDAEHIISVQYLKEFKREYINLSSTIIDFSESLLTLYIDAYQDIPTLYDGKNYIDLTDSQLENYSRLALTKTIIYTLRPTISYINSFDGVYKKYEKDCYMEMVKEYSDILNNAKQVKATPQTLHAFNYTFSAYKNDVVIFNSALESIDMPTLAGEGINFDAYKYSEGDSKNYANALKVLLFSQDSMNVLKTKLTNLYN